MVIRNSDGSLSWMNDDGSIEPYSGQDQAASTSVSTGSSAPASGTEVAGPPNPATGRIGGMGNGLDPQAISDIENRLNGLGTLAPWQTAGVDYYTWQQQQAQARQDAASKADLALQIQQRQLDLQGASTGQSAANAALSAQTAAANLAEQKRQFDLGQTTPSAYQKAQIVNDQAQRALQQAQLTEQQRQFDTSQQTPTAYQQGQLQNQQAQLQNSWNTTLAGLGSRPDTLLRYMYLARGLQPPEGINNLALPLTAPGGGGFSFAPGGAQGIQRLPEINTNPNDLIYDANMGMPSGGRPLTPPPSPTVTAGAPITTYTANPNGGLTGGATSTDFAGGAPGQVFRGIGQQAAPISFNFHANAPIAGVNAGTQTPSLSPQTASALPYFGPTDTGTASPAFVPGGYNGPGTGGVNPYAGLGAHMAHGGVISEPINGVGQWSGMPYQLGEGGKRETVVPEGKTLSQVKGKKPKKPGKYASGGDLGVSPDVFNPPNLGAVVNAPELAPGLPNIPSLGAITGGGKSLIPSPQLWNQALPSEQQAYQGALQDRFGIPSQDVSAIQARNYPKPLYRTPLGLAVLGLTAPKYTGGG